MRRLIVCGSRNFRDEVLFEQGMTQVMRLWCVQFARDWTIVHGGARGADAMADKWARDGELTVEVFPAEWELYGKAAGMRRNRQMAEAGADLCLAFPFGDSPGTWSMIREAARVGIPALIVPAL